MATCFESCGVGGYQRDWNGRIGKIGDICKWFWNHRYFGWALIAALVVWSLGLYGVWIGTFDENRQYVRGANKLTSEEGLENLRAWWWTYFFPVVIAYASYRSVTLRTAPSPPLPDELIKTAAYLTLGLLALYLLGTGLLSLDEIIILLRKW